MTVFYLTTTSKSLGSSQIIKVPRLKLFLASKCIKITYLLDKFCQKIFNCENCLHSKNKVVCNLNYTYILIADTYVCGRRICRYKSYNSLDLHLAQILCYYKLMCL